MGLRVLGGGKTWRLESRGGQEDACLQGTRALNCCTRAKRGREAHCSSCFIATMAAWGKGISAASASFLGSMKSLPSAHGSATLAVSICIPISAKPEPRPPPCRTLACLRPAPPPLLRVWAARPLPPERVLGAAQRAVHLTELWAALAHEALPWAAMHAAAQAAERRRAERAAAAAAAVAAAADASEMAP